MRAPSTDSERRCSFVPGDPAQHGIHQRGEARCTRIGLGVGDGEVDGGAVRHIQEKDLRRTDMQDVRQRRRIAPAGASAAATDQRLDGAAMTQRADQDRAHQRTVTRLQRPVLRMTMLGIGQAVQWGFGVDDGGKQPRRGLPRTRGRAGRLLGVHGIGHRLPCFARRRRRTLHDQRPLPALFGPVGLRPHGLDFCTGSAGSSAGRSWRAPRTIRTARIARG